MKLYNSGIRQVDICKEMNATKGTISGIIKKAKMKENKK
jgi:transcriptional regulator